MSLLLLYRRRDGEGEEPGVQEPLFEPDGETPVLEPDGETPVLEPES